MILKCKMCGGDLTVLDGSVVVECEYCGTQQTVPGDEGAKKTHMFNRANRLRMAAEFDKAAGIYESITGEFPQEAEAYWGLCLCAYGIEYVDDPATGRKIPTCHRTRPEPIMDSENFDLACEYADAVAKRLYREEAKEIDRLQREILAIVRSESPYDVFICYKETGEDGERTEDSVLAQDIYDALTAKGMKVFFARITLEDKLGLQYEPYIYAALHSAKVMLVVGTCFEHFDATWVKNEWARFLDMMKEDHSKVLIPCYKNLDAYDMPKEFRNLQAQDMNKLGFMQDLVRGVEKLTGKNIAPAAAAAQPAQSVVINQQGAGVESLMRRAQLFLEDGDWENAREYLDKVLDINPEYAPAYVGKVLAALQIRKENKLATTRKEFESSADWKKAMRFADPQQRAVYAEYVAESQEVRRCSDIYKQALAVMKTAKTAEAYQRAAEQFAQIAGYGDADGRSKMCAERAQKLVEEENRKQEEEESRKAASYQRALEHMKSSSTSSDYRDAHWMFKNLAGYGDSAKMAEECREKQRELEAKEEEIREQQRKIEVRNMAAARAKRTRITLIICAAFALLIAATAVYVNVIEPADRYKQAEAFIEQGKYQAATELFEALAQSGYKDAAQRIGEPYYVQAENYLAQGLKLNAAKAFGYAGEYKDASSRMKELYYQCGTEYETQGLKEEAIDMYRLADDHPLAAQRLKEMINRSTHTVEGFQPITVQVELYEDGTIAHFEVTEHNETWGFGKDLIDAGFDHLIGQHIADAQIDIKAGVTMTCNGLNEALQKAAQDYRNQ